MFSRLYHRLQWKFAGLSAVVHRPSPLTASRRPLVHAAAAAAAAVRAADPVALCCALVF